MRSTASWVFSEERTNRPFEVALVDGASPVDEDRLRIPDAPERAEPPAGAVADDRLAQPEAPHEGAGVGAEVEYVHPEDCGPAPRDAALPALEQRRLLAAGPAPGGP